MQMGLVMAKITGIVLCVLGVMMIGLGIFLHFVIPQILENSYLLADDQQHIVQEFLSGIVGSIFVGGLVAFGSVDIIISIGLLKQQKWAWKALTILTIVCVSINIVIVIGLPNTTSFTMVLVGGIADACCLFYLYRKRSKQKIMTANQNV